MDNSRENVQPFGMDDTIRRCRGKRCLCCLPIEILLIIPSHLSVGDYMSFQSVCKSWQCAFLEYSPLISQKAKRKGLPWFVLLKLDPDSKELETTGEIGDLSTRRIYTTGIPGSRVLSSNHGWLLLYFFSENKGASLFFLNPFSRARIVIPLLDDLTELTCPVFNTSAPPTSPDCMVFVVSSSSRSKEMKINTCRRGEAVWQTHTYNRPYGSASPVVNTVFVDKVWYCLHENASFTTFDIVTRVWGVLRSPAGVRPGPVSHVCKRGNRVYMCIYGFHFNEVRLKRKRLSVSRSYFTGRRWQLLYDYLIRTSPEVAFMLMKEYDLKVDTFSARAWCISRYKDGDIMFRWHGFKSVVDGLYSSHLKGRCCHPRDDDVDDDCSTFITWIEPIWVQPSTNLSWMS